MNKLFPWVAIVILIGLNSWSIYKLKRSSEAAKEIEALATIRKNELASCKSDFFTLKQNVAQAYRIGHIKPLIPEGLDSFVRTGPEWLVLRVQQNNCNLCVDKSIRMLREKRPDIFSRLLILADYPTAEAFFRDIGQTPSCPVILCPGFETDENRNSNPYYFTINNRGQIGNVIIPNWKMMDLFEHYIKEL